MDAIGKRREVLQRALACSPFLRETAIVFPDIVDAFVEKGAQAAVPLALNLLGDDVGAELRRRRTALALAVALGDLAGELSLEDVTHLLSDFADEAIDDAIREAIRERAPDAEPQG